mgnify:CR=1 FL=1
MKKIPTLFTREFQNHIVTGISPALSDPSLQWVLDGEGVATEKIDGACCAIINGIFYKRYDAKKDKRGNLKTPPEGCIPCDDPDPVTGHWPHWQPITPSDPGSKWYLAARENTLGPLADGTYEAVGPHFQGNPYGLEADTIKRHGEIVIPLPDRSFEGIRDYLRNHVIEGIVFWKDGKPQCKIKRRDFGFKWPPEA